MCKNFKNFCIIFSKIDTLEFERAYTCAKLFIIRYIFIFFFPPFNKVLVSLTACGLHFVQTFFSDGHDRRIRKEAAEDAL